MKLSTDNLIRKINAFLAIFLVCFFALHAILGTGTLYELISKNYKFIVWIGVGVIVAHIIGSVATTYYMYTDPVRPPSDRKKRHQVLKWATGIAVGGVAIIHITTNYFDIPTNKIFEGFLLLVLLAAFAIHSNVGAKSLTRDLGLSKTWRTPIKAAVICLTAALAICVCAALFI